jgi:LysM repeat protein
MEFYVELSTPSFEDTGEMTPTTDKPKPILRSFSNRSPAPTNNTQLRQSVEHQKEALVQVSRILNKLEKVESLYPTYKALKKDFELYSSAAFQQRVNTLLLWMNITKDLGKKLQLVAKILNLHTIEGLTWPWLEYESPEPTLQRIRNAVDIITPEIVVSEAGGGDYEEYSGSEEEEEEEEGQEEEDNSRFCVKGALDDSGSTKCNNKSVTFSHDVSGTPEGEDVAVFDTPSDTSTPLKAPSRQTSCNSSLTVSRSSSNMSFNDFVSGTSIYRQFADKMLRKTGLRKLQMRLVKLLSNTVKRAEKALERTNVNHTATYAEVVLQVTRITFLSMAE